MEFPQAASDAAERKAEAVEFALSQRMSEEGRRVNNELASMTKMLSQARRRQISGRSNSKFRVSQVSKLSFKAYDLSVSTSVYDSLIVSIKRIRVLKF